MFHQVLFVHLVKEKKASNKNTKQLKMPQKKAIKWDFKYFKYLTVTYAQHKLLKHGTS